VGQKGVSPLRPYRPCGSLLVMEIMTFPELGTPCELRVQVLELQQAAWPQEGGPTAHDQELSPVSMLLVVEGQVLAALDVLSKEIVHAGVGYKVSGLSTVITRADARRHGYGRRLVMAAREAIADSGAALGIFTCDRPLQGCYESAGWQHLAGTTLIGGTLEEPFPSDRPGFDKVTMAAFFSPSDQGAFLDTRVQLYPGKIDRLW